MNPDQQIDLYRAARAIAWSYKLEQYDAAALKDLQRIVEKSKTSIVQKFADGLGQEGSYTRKHFQNSLKELDRLSLGLQQQLGEALTTSTSRIGSLALKEWGESLSVGGVSKMVNTVALSPEQFAAFFKRNPPAGILIPKVMRNAINQGVTARIQGELLDVLREGALTGQSYKRIVDKLSESFTDFSRHQLTTLTRTFFQTANAQAFDAVYQANQDIMEGKIWTNVNDDRVCLQCLPLGEVLYKKGEPHPPMPRHPNCRCMFRAKTVSYRSLGIDLDELEDVVQPVVTRGYEKNGKWIIPPAGTGTGRGPRAISFYQGGMKEAFPDLPVAQQKAMLGVGRYNLYKSGELSLDQLADPTTGKLWLLKELDEGMHLRGMVYADYKTNPLDTSKINKSSITDATFKEILAASSDGVDDPLMAGMNRISGADILPTKVDAATFDKLIPDSKSILYRGVRGDVDWKTRTEINLAQQFIDGDFFAGRGIYGNGSYTASTDKVRSIDRALQCIDTTRGYGDDTIRMLLKADAKVIDFDDLNTRLLNEKNAWELANVPPPISTYLRKVDAGEMTEELAEKAYRDTRAAYQKKKEQLERLYWHDQGKYALSEGYDAIVVKQGRINYTVLLNRGAVIVDASTYKNTHLYDSLKSIKDAKE